MADEPYDPLLMNFAQQAGGIEQIFDKFFGFLNRKTDFFSAHDDKKRSKVVLDMHFEKYWREGQIKRDEMADRAKFQKQRQDGVEQNKLEEAQRAWEEKEAAKKIGEQNKIEEVDVSTPVGVQELADEENKEKAGGEETSQGQEAKEDDSPPPEGNGGTNEHYKWIQTLGTVEMFVPIKPGTAARQLDVKITGSKIMIGLKNQEPMFSGELFAKVKSDDTMWLVEDKQTIHITLEKYDGMAWWPTVVKGHTEIETKNIVPESSKLSDLDGETRQTVEKMMFDQRAKAAGKPTSDQSKQHDMLEKFKKAHPEMDFSNAKINYGGDSGMQNFPGMQ